MVIERICGIVTVELDVVVVEINRLVLIAEVAVAVHLFRADSSCASKPIAVQTNAQNNSFAFDAARNLHT